MKEKRGAGPLLPSDTLHTRSLLYTVGQGQKVVASFFVRKGLDSEEDTKKKEALLVA